MKKIPCIKCDQKLWEYIEPNLEKWEYQFIDIGYFEACPILVLNSDGILGLCINLSTFTIDEYDRELVTNVEEFLQRAAELKGYNYKRKDIVYPEDLVGDINGFPIEIVQHMVNEQVLQGNPPNITVFQKINYRNKNSKGFDWDLSKDGDSFWHKVIINRNFELYFEKYPKQTNMKQFTKEDLQSGMVVKLRNGRKYLVVEDLLIGRDGFMRLYKYNDDLTLNTGTEYDIVMVYKKTDSWGEGFVSGLHHGNIIWEREEIKEFTMQEIADKLGIPVKQLRIKK